MKRSVIQGNVDEILDPSQEMIEEIAEIVEQVAPAHSLPSYQPTRWASVNQLLDRVDVVTKGRAGTFVQFFLFLFFGGSTAIVNMAIMDVILYWVAMPVLGANAHYIIADAIGTEISVIVNFMLNDTFTFRHMDGHARSWWARFGRFQMTALSGSVLTILLSTGFHMMLHMTPTISQAIAIIIVTFYNFFFHQIFTYRSIKPARSVA
jgi:putative flippase GtrA